MKAKNHKIALPMAILLLGTAGSVGLIAVRPAVSTTEPPRLLPLVRTMIAQPETVRLVVEAQGTVVPRTESELVAEVAGRIIAVSPSLASGGFIEPDEVLVRIDPTDYQLAVRRAEATVERSASQLALARSNLERRRNLAEQGVASAAALDDASNAQRVAAASHQDALAAHEQALRDLARTEIRAPFAGRVREKRVDVGQFVGRGASVARVYAVDYAEVRLPIPDDDAAFLDLPIAYRGGEALSEPTGPAVELHARFAGRAYRWKGRIVRTEGELDPHTRMIHAVARVENPYGRGEDPSRPPLAVGLFVSAIIEGREVADVVRLPREALRGADQVVLVKDGRLELRDVVVLQRGEDSVLVSAGLTAGDEICTSPLPITVDGMEVQVQAQVQHDEQASRSAAGTALANLVSGEPTQ